MVRDAVKAAERDNRMASLDFDMITLAVDNARSERERVQGSFPHYIRDLDQFPGNDAYFETSFTEVVI